MKTEERDYFISANEICARYKISASKLRRWIDGAQLTGIPDHVMHGNRRVWRRDEFEAWEREVVVSWTAIMS